MLCSHKPVKLIDLIHWWVMSFIDGKSTKNNGRSSVLFHHIWPALKRLPRVCSADMEVVRFTVNRGCERPNWIVCWLSVKLKLLWHAARPNVAGARWKPTRPRGAIRVVNQSTRIIITTVVCPKSRGFSGIWGRTGRLAEPASFFFFLCIISSEALMQDYKTSS